MTQGSVITDEMRKAIGVESEPTILQIEKEPIRRFAEAIGDPNPVYHDEEYAKKLGYRSVIAPPGFHPQYSFPLKKPSRPAGPRFRSPFTRMLNGGNEYEFSQPIQAGDILSMTSRLADIYERPGRMGPMLFTISEEIFRNQKGETVLIMRHTGISY
ncbi:MAG: MaoC family dehydratase N-terminal domain-containing protein [Dehalococcoidia bacterium]|nr:MaoC family dehydratase N-terminal domain-containing protein [Dehalococcoidia bacterium]